MKWLVKCKECGKRKFSFFLNHQGLCKLCEPRVYSIVKRHGDFIKDCLSLIDRTPAESLRLSRYKLLIENARSLIHFELKGIPTIKPHPSKIVEEFSRLHDGIIFNELEEMIREESKGLKQLSPAAREHKFEKMFYMVEEKKRVLYEPSKIASIEAGLKEQINHLKKGE